MSSPRLRLRQYTYTPDSTTRGRVVPTMTLKVDSVFGGVSSCNATVSEAAFSNLPAFPFVAAVELSDGNKWVELTNGRFIFTGDDLDAVDPAGVRTLTGTQFVPWLLQRALMMPAPVNPQTVNGARLWAPDGCSPGHIVPILMSEAKDRGWGLHLFTMADNTHDSAGNAWATNDLKNNYDIGTPLWQIMTGLISDGVMEFISLGSEVAIYTPGHGVDRSTGAGVVRLSHEASSIPVKRSWDNVLTFLTVAGDNNLLATFQVTGAPSTFGRLEGWMDSAGTKGSAALRSVSNQTKTAAATPTRQITVTSDAHNMPNLPWTDYDVGDWVQVHAENGWEKGRVVEIIGDQDQDGNLSLTTTLGDRKQSLLSKLASKTVASTKGAAGSTKPVTINTNPPIAAASLTGTAQGYWDAANVARSRVSLTWDAVAFDTEGEAADIAQYQVWVRYTGQTKAASLATIADNSFTREGLPVGTTAFFTVRAQTSDGVWGAFTAEFGLELDAPEGSLLAPDAPTFVAAPQGMLAHWDGLLGGSPAPGYFSYLYAMTSTTEGGTYTPASGTLSGTGDILLPTTGAVWVVFVAVDRQGNESPWSTAVQVTAQPAAPSGLAAAVNAGGWDVTTGSPVSTVTITWDAVTVDILGNPITCDAYEVWLKVGDADPQLFQTVSAPTVSFMVAPNTPLVIMVRAHSTTGYWSDLSTEFGVQSAAPTDTLTAPDDPTYTTAHSVLVASWDGLLDGLVPPPQFWHVIVEKAPDVAGAAGDFAQVGELSTAGDVTIAGVAMGDIVWIRLTGVDQQGAVGASSNPVQVTVVGTTGDDIVAGSITANQLSPTIGGDLDLSANDSITLTVGRIDDLSDSLNDTNDALNAQQTVFSIQSDGAHIFSPGGENELVIKDDEIDMQVQGNTVTFWNQQVMNVNSAVVTELVVGNIHFQADGNGTVIRAI